jgi:hypothetical protein
MFRLRPEYEVVKLVEEEKWISVLIRCRLYNIATGEAWGEGLGSANTREKRYLNQASAKACPRCQKPAIIKGKEEYGGGWLCFEKKGGCKAKFKDGDKSIESQTGEVQSDAVWDLHNTITKMACKRAKVGAVLTATGASDCFTQDLEDLIDYLPTPVETKRPATFAAAKPENPNKDKSTKKWSATKPVDGSSAENAVTGEVNAPPVTGAQIKKIHVLKAKCGITDADWRSRMKAKFGVESSKDLDMNQAATLIDALDRLASRAEEALREVGQALSAAGAVPEREPGSDDIEDSGDAPTAEEWDEMKTAMERDK